MLREAGVAAAIMSMLLSGPAARADNIHAKPTVQTKLMLKHKHVVKKGRVHMGPHHTDNRAGSAPAKN